MTAAIPSLGYLIGLPTARLLCAFVLFKDDAGIKVIERHGLATFVIQAQFIATDEAIRVTRDIDPNGGMRLIDDAIKNFQLTIGDDDGIAGHIVVQVGAAQ